MRTLPPVVPGAVATAAVAVSTALALTVLTAPAAHADDGKGGKGNDGFSIKDPRITESSGLVASRAHPGVYWTHNDQDKGAFLYAVDSATGKTVATVTMTGVGKPRDIEAISMGPDGDLYVGDIGDNLGGKWSFVWIYKLPEPKQLKDQSIRAKQYVVKYSDGPRDAESMMVHPKTGRVYIVDKKEDGEGSLYQGPPPARMSTSRTNVFQRVADVDLWATDGAFSPNGKQLALRGYLGGVTYRWEGDGKIKRVDIASGAVTEIPFTAEVDQALGPLVHFDYELNDSTVTVQQIRNARPSPDGRRCGCAADLGLDSAFFSSAGGSSFFAVLSPPLTARMIATSPPSGPNCSPATRPRS